MQHVLTALTLAGVAAVILTGLLATGAVPTNAPAVLGPAARDSMAGV